MPTNAGPRLMQARGLRLLISAVLLLTVSGTTVPVARAATSATPAASPRPGVQFGVDNGYQAPEMERQLGVTWDRIDFRWNVYQPTGPTDWVEPDNPQKVATDLQNGISVVGVITNPPKWGTRNGSVPVNLDHPFDDPANYWAAFVGKLAKEYAGQVSAWIIWNEPDIDPGQPYSTWAGSELEYYETLKSASQAIKAADPTARVVFAGTTYWIDVNARRPLFLERVLVAADDADPSAAANGYYFDAVDIHVYSSPVQVYNVPQAYRQAMAKHGIDKPIWISELNIVPWNDPASMVPRGGNRGSLDEQAAYMIQATAYAVAARVERVAVYQMKDGEIINGEPYGLVRNDMTPRPAYAAYQTAIRLFSGLVAGGISGSGTAVEIALTAGPHRVTVAWDSAPQPTSVAIAPLGITATVIDKVGNSHAIGLPTDPAHPDYEFDLPGATDNTVDKDPTIYLVGGDPVLLSEDGIGQGVAVGPDAFFYPITGFVISGPFLDYFQHRGGLQTFGYPTSRQFQLNKATVQIFQRRVLQMQPDGSVGQLNLLDSDVMPYTQFNGATIPAVDPSLTKSLPLPGSSGYVTETLSYVNRMTPDVWQGLRVNFLHTYTTTVTLNDAFPGSKGHADLLPGFNFEQWGVPTSLPTPDPHNSNFIYQRFQRGILHYDRTTGLTQGLLLGDVFKEIITGVNLPADLDGEASGSRFYRQYQPNAPGWLARPGELPDTDLTNAFERQAAAP